MSDYDFNACLKDPSILGGACGPEQAPGGPRATDAYAQPKPDYYSNPFLNGLHTRRRVLEARRDKTVQQLNVLTELLGLLVD